MNYQADNNGFYGQYGGAYVPEILFKAVENLRMPLTWNANVPTSNVCVCSAQRSFLSAPAT